MTIDRMPRDLPLLSIAEVERQTGVPRATIRMWERRYGFPAPQRDDRGERSYPDDQVSQLKLMRQLLEQGHRPARLLAEGAAEMKRLAAARPMQAAARPGVPTRLAAEVLRLLRQHDPPALRRELEMRLARSGLAEFVAADLSDMNWLVGEAWAAGEIEIHEEHLYSDCVYEVVRNAIARLAHRQRPEAPQVVLTTFPQEPHGLGLLMAQALFALEGCPVTSLGVRLPIEQIVASARAYRADLVGLSFTAALNPTHVRRGLEELRGLLPTTVRIWAGGANPALRKRALPGVRYITDVRSIPLLLAEDFALPPMARRTSAP